ncbi:hypothetical protein PENTCL1PPCAC_8561, partial [Pristionchus entomophagus]
VIMSSGMPLNLEEENKALRETVARLTEEKRKCEEEIERLSQYSSKFSKEFKVESILGNGFSGCVFETSNSLDDGKYAVKRIAVEPKEEIINKTLREVRAMAKLDHPNIIRYNSTWIERPPDDWQYKADEEILENIKSRRRQLLHYKPNSVFIYIQMQLCKFSLTQWLNENMVKESRPIHRMKNWFKQIINAVECIHEHKHIHRDLKPCNILYITNDHLKICDMGIVAQQRVENGVEITMTRTKAGTAEYMSPEQASFVSRINAKSDIFTLGLILAELCVVMSYEEKVKFFDNYRMGKPSLAFEDEKTAKFVGWLTNVDNKKRPDCKEMLDHLYLASY